MSDLDPIQNNCVYGYVLPDRCRYNSSTGCACGAYPPLTAEKITSKDFPRLKRIEEALKRK